MLEGTGKYFLILFIIFFIVYLTVKICLSKLFKEAKIESWKAYIPFYNRLVLIKLLDLKKSLFYKTLIPIVNLYYYKIIISELLKAYKMDPKDAIWFIIIPMYKFPELVFKQPKFMLHMYDDTEEFISNQNILFTQETKNQTNTPVKEITESNVVNQYNPNSQTSQNEIIIKPESYNQVQENISEKPQVNISNSNNVFLNPNLENNSKQETIIQPKPQEEKHEEQKIAFNSNAPKVCPNCGTKLSPNATTCFLCGTKLL